MTLLVVCPSVVGVRSAEAQPSQPPAAVVVADVVERELAEGQTFVGAVVPSRRSIVGSAVDGRVVELLVNDGDAVGLVEQDGRQVGQPIAQLLTATIGIQIEAARAEARLREQELAELEAGSRPEEITQAAARLQAADAVKQYATARFRRIKTLFEAGATASKEEFDEATSASLAAEQNHAAAKAGYDLVVAGPRKERIDQARAQLAMANEMVNELTDRRKKYTIRAPFEGYVVAKQTEVGEWVSRGDPVAEIVALDPIEIDVTVPEKYITHVRRGATARVHIDALPGQEFIGQVARVVPQADLRSRSFPVKLRLANPQTDDSHLLKVGMLAHVTLAVGKPQQAMLVPKDALVLGGPMPMVMVVRDEEGTLTAAPTPVRTGVADGSLIQVIGELQPGQQVIVVGNERIRPGQAIRPIKADESADD